MYSLKYKPPYFVFGNTVMAGHISGTCPSCNRFRNMLVGANVFIEKEEVNSKQPVLISTEAMSICPECTFALRSGSWRFKSDTVLAEDLDRFVGELKCDEDNLSLWVPQGNMRLSMDWIGVKKGRPTAACTDCCNSNWYNWSAFESSQVIIIAQNVLEESITPKLEIYEFEFCAVCGEVASSTKAYSINNGNTDLNIAMALTNRGYTAKQVIENSDINPFTMFKKEFKVPSIPYNSNNKLEGDTMLWNQYNKTIQAAKKPEATDRGYYPGVSTYVDGKWVSNFDWKDNRSSKHTVHPEPVVDNSIIRVTL